MKKSENKEIVYCLNLAEDTVHYKTLDNGTYNNEITLLKRHHRRYKYNTLYLRFCQDYSINIGGVFFMENSTSIQTFTNEEFGEIRIVMINAMPWFVGKDAAKALGYERPTKAVNDRVDIEDRDAVPIQDSIGRMQKTPIINESGLYSLILSSKLPTAQKFKRWVTSEVLPSIRKYGAYMTPETIEKVLYNPEFIINLASQLKAEQEKNEVLTIVCQH